VGGAPGFGSRCVKSDVKVARPQSSSSSRPSTSMPSPGSSLMAPRVLLTHDGRVRRQGVHARIVSFRAAALGTSCGRRKDVAASAAPGVPTNRTATATSAATRSGSVICTGPRRLRPSRAGKSEDGASDTSCVAERSAGRGSLQVPAQCGEPVRSVAEIAHIAEAVTSLSEQHLVAFHRM